jgi:hypothetical protein
VPHLSLHFLVHLVFPYWHQMWNLHHRCCQEINSQFHRLSCAQGYQWFRSLQ